MSTMQWFRLYSEAVDDEKLRLLAFEDRWHFIAILCCKSKGIIDDASDIMRRKVAVKLGVDLPTLDDIARRLSEVGLIDRHTLQPLQWHKRQFDSDNSTDRVRKFRQRLDNIGNVSETLRETKDETDVKRFRNVLDTDTETESTQVVHTVGGCGGERKAAAKAAVSIRKTKLRNSFRISDRVRKWAEENGYGDLDRHFEFFILQCQAKGYSYADWDAALMTAIRDDWAKIRRKSKSGTRRHAAEVLTGTGHGREIDGESVRVA